MRKEDDGEVLSPWVCARDVLLGGKCVGGRNNFINQANMCCLCGVRKLEMSCVSVLASL